MSVEIVRWLHTLRQELIKLTNDNTVTVTVIVDQDTDMQYVLVKVEYLSICTEFDLTDANFNESDELMKHCLSRLQNAMQEMSSPAVSAESPQWLAEFPLFYGKNSHIIH